MNESVVVRTPDEWSAAHPEIDHFFKYGAKALKGWYPNSEVTETEYLKAINDFRGVKLGPSVDHGGAQ